MVSSPFYFSFVRVILLYALLFGGTNTMVAADDQCSPPCIIPVCMTVGGGSWFFDVQFCEAALGSDGRSVNAGMDYRTYAIIAADLLTANTTNTAANIDSLLREGGGQDDATARGLRSCQALYSGIMQILPSCKAAIKDKRDAEATSLLERSASAAKECEDGFGKSNVTSPVTAEDNNAFQLAKLSVALLAHDYHK